MRLERGPRDERIFAALAEAPYEVHVLWKLVLVSGATCFGPGGQQRPFFSTKHRLGSRSPILPEKATAPAAMQPSFRRFLVGDRKVGSVRRNVTSW